jgi:hypothetical protein
MTTTDPSVPGYALPNHCELAEQRLALLEACHDGASIRRAEALGVAPRVARLVGALRPGGVLLVERTTSTRPSRPRPATTARRGWRSWR